jgi:hypothetical protein
MGFGTDVDVGAGGVSAGAVGVDVSAGDPVASPSSAAASQYPFSGKNEERKHHRRADNHSLFPSELYFLGFSGRIRRSGQI